MNSFDNVQSDDFAAEYEARQAGELHPVECGCGRVLTTADEISAELCDQCAAEMEAAWADEDDYYSYEDEYDYPEDNFRDDVEADADTLASAGWGTDEDYGGCCDWDCGMDYDFGYDG